MDQHKRHPHGQRLLCAMEVKWGRRDTDGIKLGFFVFLFKLTVTPTDNQSYRWFCNLSTAESHIHSTLPRSPTYAHSTLTGKLDLSRHLWKLFCTDLEFARTMMHCIDSKADFSWGRRRCLLTRWTWDLITGMMEPQRNNNTAISRCGWRGILWLDLASLLLPHSCILVCVPVPTHPACSL
ncbi:hypothetical protein Pelo_14389 [Pelomyxa schiedti]|nr:hypothetical protein Pelo_14389 [Pelomyxa schiedti]